MEIIQNKIGLAFYIVPQFYNILVADTKYFILRED